MGDVSFLLLQGIGDLLPLSELWGSALGFVLIWIAVVAGIGIGSRNLAIGAVGGYLSFTYFALAAGIGLLETVLYVSLTLVIIGFSFKLWRLEGLDSTGS